MHNRFNQLNKEHKDMTPAYKRIANESGKFRLQNKEMKKKIEKYETIIYGPKETTVAKSILKKKQA